MQAIRENKPIHCKKCGLVLLKISDIAAFLYAPDVQITVRCRCEKDNRISLDKMVEIRIELIEKQI